MTDKPDDRQPCPFCGAIDIVETWNEFDEHLIMCVACAACGPAIHGDCNFAEAWRRWNERAKQKGPLS